MLSLGDWRAEAYWLSCGWPKIIDRERGIELGNGGECLRIKDYDFLPCSFNQFLIPENTE